MEVSRPLSMHLAVTDIKVTNKQAANHILTIAELFGEFYHRNRRSMLTVNQILRFLGIVRNFKMPNGAKLSFLSFF